MAGIRKRLTFIGGAGDELSAALELPEEDVRGYALFAHCFTCSKDIVAASQISRALSNQGIGVLRFDFTGLGSSQGDFANTNFSSNIEDLLAAAEFMRSEFRPPAVLIGHSLGGAAVVATAGGIPEAGAVVIIGAPSDPDHVRHLIQSEIEEIESTGSANVTLAGREFQIKKSFLEDISAHNLKHHLAELARPILILHSPTDSVVGIEHAKRNFEAARHPKSFISLDNADHLLMNRSDAIWVGRTISAWSYRYLDT
jgi:putative redox protein